MAYCLYGRRLLTSKQMSRWDDLFGLIERASSVFKADGRIEAAWLEGSFAAGTADEWSDIDLNVAVADESFDAVVAKRHDMLGRIGGVLGYGEARMPDGFLIFANLEGLRRLDLVLFRSSDLAIRHRPQVKLLFDKTGITDRLRTGEPRIDLKAAVEAQLQGFFYGSFQPLRLWNRGEWGSLQMGCYMVLFQHVVPLWLAVDDPANAFRPHLHNERFLSATRRERISAFLAGLHHAFAGDAPDADDAKRVLAEAFEMAFAALREACERWGVDYPAESEASVRQTYRAELGLKI
jgi:predicted nucleotidyltransferase